MSWEAVILRLSGPFRPIEEVADDEYLPLGGLDSVVAAVRAAYPDAQWEDATCAHLQLDKHTGMMIDLSHVEESNSIHVSVSGPCNPVPALLSLANANGWVVLDCSSSEFIDPEALGAEGFEGYQSMWDGAQEERGDSDS